jgi:hypothetical protein
MILHRLVTRYRMVNLLINYGIGDQKNVKKKGPNFK